MIIWHLLRFSSSLDQSSATKREVLQQSSRIFDPLGFTAPVTISAKLLLQRLWQKKLPWDVPLPSEYQQQWQTLLHDLQHLHTVSIPRCYWKNGMSTDAPVELHIFCDASTTRPTVQCHTSVKGIQQPL